MSDDLRELLRSAVPEPPVVPDRATGARVRYRRARRRTALAASAATVVAVASLAVVPGMVADDDPSPAPAPSPPAGGCPAPDTPADGADELPDDPTSVRLCPGTATDFDAPEDALLGAAAQTVVALVDTQPLAEDESGCGPGSAYLLVFAYPDGDTQVVRAAEGCRHLQVGDTLREDADAALSKLVQELHEQRRAADPPEGLAVRPACDAVTSPFAGISPIVVATLCGPSLGSGAPVPPADLRVLLDDATPEAHAEPIPPGLDGLEMTGATQWGDVQRLTVGRDWWPGLEAQEVLGRLVAESGTPDAVVDESSTPTEVVAAYVGRLNAGDPAGADALWMSLVSVPQSPHTASYVGADVRKVRSLPSVSAWQDATAVTTRYREVRRDGTEAGYRTVVFLLGRDENGALRIVSMGR